MSDEGAKPISILHAATLTPEERARRLEWSEAALAEQAAARAERAREIAKSPLLRDLEEAIEFAESARFLATAGARRGFLEMSQVLVDLITDLDAVIGGGDIEAIRLAAGTLQDYITNNLNLPEPDPPRAVAMMLPRPDRED